MTGLKKLGSLVLGSLILSGCSTLNLSQSEYDEYIETLQINSFVFSQFK
jgi:hypothetical protein